ncbi:hypothetical protein B1R27_12255 [Streptomyces sp. GKU 895]|nr:hypothetical protein B1R27_12255 [Streptomyces sp. GKU 895]
MKRLRARLADLDRRRRHRSTARAMLRLNPEPESWLDVGTGEAHFPAEAKAFFPYTSFDGLDTTTAVLVAREAERLEEAYLGTPAAPHLSKALTARYDVISVLKPVASSARSWRSSARAAMCWWRPREPPTRSAGNSRPRTARSSPVPGTPPSTAWRGRRA